MEAYQYHVYVCNQKKPEGIPGCAAHGSDNLIAKLRAEIGKNGLGDTVQVTTCGSIGLCERGPNMVVYPEGIWYSGVKEADIAEIINEHFKAGRVVERLVNNDAAALKAEIELNKGKMMAALKANDAAGMLPEDILQNIRGFQTSRVILSAIELDIFTAVGQKASSEEVAAKISADPRATETFLNALAALKLLEKRDGQFYNTAISQRYFMADSPDDSRGSIMHSAHMWNRWSTLTECVRKGTSVTYKEFSERGDEWTEAFIAAMHKNAGARAPMVAKAAGASGVKRMLDVGGGSSAYSIAFARANENLRAVVFDLADVTAIAQRHIDKAGLSERVKTQVGNFHDDELGNGFDLVFMSAICHMNGPEENVALFRKSLAALNSGGRIVIQDFILNDEKTSPTTAAIFALNMLVGTRLGSSYSQQEYFGWLKEAGFDGTQMINLPGPTDLIVGVRK